MSITFSVRLVTDGEVASVQPALEDEVLPAGGQVVGAAQLAHVADPGPDLLRLAGHVETGHRGRAGVDGEQGRHHPQGGRLARPVGTEEPEDLAPRHVDAHPADRVDIPPLRAERLPQTVLSR